MSQPVKIKDAITGARRDFFSKNHGSLAVCETVQLTLGRVHEAMGNSADIFAVLLAAQLKGPVIWIGRHRDVGSIAPTALQLFFDPARLIVTECNTRKEMLWASEQAMRMPAAACVITEMADGPDLKESRRLQIAAEEGGCLGLILIAGAPQTSAAETRWECLANANDDGPWRWTLTKNKCGPVGTWQVKWLGGKDAPGVIHLAAATAA